MSGGCTTRNYDGFSCEGSLGSIVDGVRLLVVAFKALTRALCCLSFSSRERADTKSVLFNIKLPSETFSGTTVLPCPTPCLRAKVESWKIVAATDVVDLLVGVTLVVLDVELEDLASCAAVPTGACSVCPSFLPLGFLQTSLQSPWFRQLQWENIYHLMLALVQHEKTQ